MKTLLRPELQAPLPRLQLSDAVAGMCDPSDSAVVAATSKLFRTPRICPAHERHVRRPSWTELFFDLVFAAAIAQLSGPLDHDYSIYGTARFAFLLALIFLAWFGYTTFSTQFAVDDVVERVLMVAQVFLVAVMAANVTGTLSSRDAAGFGAAYGGVRGILALQYARVIQVSEVAPFVRRRIVGLVTAAILWAASALLPPPYRYVGWSFAFLIDIANSWPASRSTTASPPGATHFPERFGLLTIILLGEFVASVMRGIESQMGWSFLAASAAVLSLALGFAIWSCYSDGAVGWETRHVQSHKDVVRLRAWIVLHFALFLGVAVLGVGARRAIGLPAGEHFTSEEQWIICSASAGIILTVMSIAATSEHRIGSRRSWVWLSQSSIALVALALAPLSSQIIATALLLLLFLCFVAQTAVLLRGSSAVGRRGDLGQSGVSAAAAIYRL